MNVCNLGKTEAQSRNQLGNGRSKNDKVLIFMQQSENKKRGKEEKRKESSDYRRREDWGKEEEIEEDHRKIKEMVPEKFLKQRKVFGKIKSERILMRKVWDHAIDLKDTFVL